MRKVLALGLALCLGTAAFANDVAYVSGSSGEPWGMPGNVNAMNDVFGAGNWDRLSFPSAVQQGVFNYKCLFLDGGDGADSEFNAFIDTNRATLEAWVAGGGKLLVNAARWGSSPTVLDLGFGITLDNNFPHDTSTAPNLAHPIFNGPWGATGNFFDGDFLSHDIVYGGGLTPLLYGSNDPSQVTLGEKAYGAGWVIAGGLTLPFFGEHPLWNPDTRIMHRNLLEYMCVVPEPASLSLLLIGAAGLLRRR